jgi:hypothetical protein
MANQTAYTSLTLPEIARSSLAQDNLQEYTIPWTVFRVWDAVGTLLPVTAGTDDLALIPGTWATNSPAIKTSDASGTSIAQYAWFEFSLPPEYVAAQRVYIRFRAKVAANVNVAQTIDVVAYESDNETLISADLVTTAAQSLTTAYANYDFVLTPASLVAGDRLVCRLHVAMNDTGAANASIGTVGKVSFLCDIKG